MMEILWLFVGIGVLVFLAMAGVVLLANALKREKR